MRRCSTRVRNPTAPVALALAFVFLLSACGPADFEEHRDTYQRAAELVIENNGETTPELQRLKGELGINQIYYDAEDQIVALRWNGGFILGVREYLYSAGGDSLQTFDNSATGYYRTHLGGRWYYQELAMDGPE